MESALAFPPSLPPPPSAHSIECVAPLQVENKSTSRGLQAAPCCSNNNNHYNRDYNYNNNTACIGVSASAAAAQENVEKLWKLRRVRVCRIKLPQCKCGSSSSNCHPAAATATYLLPPSLPLYPMPLPCLSLSAV